MSQEFEQDGSGLRYGVQSTRNTSIRKPRKAIPKFNLYNSTCEIFEQYGWRKSFIRKSITHDFANEIEDYSIIDSLTALLEKEFNKNPLELSEETLYKLGLKRVKARLYYSIIEDLINTCYTNEQLLQIIAEYAYGWNDPIGLPGKSYLYNENVIETWFTHSNKQCINIKNINDKNIDKLMSIMPEIHANKSHTLFFHATSWKSYDNILRDGIDHTLGRTCLDFGKRSSFYMTPNIYDAINWCKKSSKHWCKECGILIFSIEFANANIKQKIFKTNNKEWQDNVKESRLCKSRQILDSYDMVYGPMCANVHQVKKLDAIPIPHNPIKFQLASKTDKCDVFITECFRGVLYFYK